MKINKNLEAIYQSGIIVGFILSAFLCLTINYLMSFVSLPIINSIVNENNLEFVAVCLFLIICVVFLTLIFFMCITIDIYRKEKLKVENSYNKLVSDNEFFIEFLENNEVNL